MLLHNTIEWSGYMSVKPTVHGFKSDGRSANLSVMMERRLNDLLHVKVDYESTIWNVQEAMDAIKIYHMLMGNGRVFDYFIRVVKPSSYDFSFQVLVYYETFDGFIKRINLIWDNMKGIVQNEFELKPAYGWEWFNGLFEEK